MKTDILLSAGPKYCKIKYKLGELELGSHNIHEYESSDSLESIRDYFLKKSSKLVLTLLCLEKKTQFHRLRSA